MYGAERGPEQFRKEQCWEWSSSGHLALLTYTSQMHRLRNLVLSWQSQLSSTDGLQGQRTWIQLCRHTSFLPASIIHVSELPLVQEVHPSSHTSTATQPHHALLRGASKVLQRHCLTLWSPRACTHAHCHICIAQGMRDNRVNRDSPDTAIIHYFTTPDQNVNSTRSEACLHFAYCYISGF